MALGQPQNLFDALNAGTTFLKTLWPNGTSGILPTSAVPVQPIVSGGNTVGGIFQPQPGQGSALLDFAGVGAASQALVVEIGGVNASGELVQVIDTVTLTSIVTAGTTTANFNPFTGAATPGKTWRLFDLVAHVNKGQLGQVLTNVGGAQDNTPSQLTLDVSLFQFYYVLVTSLASLTEALCVMTPAP